MICNGVLSVKRLTRLLEKKMLHYTDDNGEMIYWQATRYLTPGYINYYWKEEENFKIKEHVCQLNKKVISSQEDLQKVMGKGCTLDKPYKSPWEFVLIPYVEEGRRKTVVHFFFSHALADGPSLAFLLVMQLAEHDPSIDLSQLRIPQHLKRSKFLLLWKTFLAIPRLCLESAIARKEENMFNKGIVT